MKNWMATTLGAFLGHVGEGAGAGEAPDDHDAGEALYGRVEAEADQGDGPRHDAPATMATTPSRVM
jgi:hypothetical protein